MTCPSNFYPETAPTFENPLRGCLLSNQATETLGTLTHKTGNYERRERQQYHTIGSIAGTAE